MAQPYADGDEFESGEEGVAEFIVARGDAAVMFDLIEEPLDQVSLSIEVRAEDDGIHAVALGRDVGPSATLDQVGPDLVDVIGPVPQQHGAARQALKQLFDQARVVRLSGREGQSHWQALGIDDGVDLGRQSASGAAHMTNSPPFLRRRRADEPGPRRCRSSGRARHKPL